MCTVKKGPCVLGVGDGLGNGLHGLHAVLIEIEDVAS